MRLRHFRMFCDNSNRTAKLCWWLNCCLIYKQLNFSLNSLKNVFSREANLWEILETTIYFKMMKNVIKEKFNDNFFIVLKILQEKWMKISSSYHSNFIIYIHHPQNLFPFSLLSKQWKIVFHRGKSLNWSLNWTWKFPQPSLEPSQLILSVMITWKRVQALEISC